MTPSRTTNCMNKRVSPFRPMSRGMDSETGSIFSIIIVSLLLIMFLAPITTSFESTNNVLQYENQASLAQIESLYHYSLPDTNIPVAVGEISGNRGFAYVIEEESRLYFIDLINDVTMDIALPEGVKANGAYLKGCDVDLDGNTEFFLRNFVNSIYYILMVDIDDATVTEFPMPFIYASPIGFGIFNGDTYPDVLIQNVNSRDDFLTLDARNNETIAEVTSWYAYNVVIGRFSSMSEDAFAFSSRDNPVSGFQNNITVVNGDGSVVQTSTISSYVQDMVAFDHLGGLEEIAAIEGNGDLVVYSGITLLASYTQAVDTSPSTTRFIETGDFNADPQDDLVVISRSQEVAFFRDGNIGFPIREVAGIYTFSSKNFGIGLMDQDAIDELAVGTTYGGLGIIRGVDGAFANLEFLVDIRSSSSHQIMSYDFVGNGRDDTIVRIANDIFILRSDTSEPIITPLPINPFHPTILDDFVIIKVQVEETSKIDYIDIWMKLPGGDVWMQPQDEMYASHAEGIFYAFIGNLQPGDYQYYIEVKDSFLNIGNLGNSTNPLIFSVAGHFVWQIDKTETDYIHRRYHQSDLGNLSDGSPVIYTIERASGDLDLTLVRYSKEGGVSDSLAIANPSGIPFENFVLFTAMLDGDNIKDIIVLDYHWDKDGILRYHAFHGNSFTLMGNGTVPYPYKSFNYLDVFDDDGDGNEELFIVSDTSPESIIKMDSDLSWSAVNFPVELGVRGFSVARGSTTGYIAVIRGETQIDIFTTDLVYLHSLDIDLSAYSNMDPFGIKTIFNSTSGEEQFVAGFNYWNATDPTGRIYIFDSSTTNLNNTPVYEMPHQDLSFLYPGHNEDELFLIGSTGELHLTQPSDTLSIVWSTPITGATPLSAVITDFDGDMEDEFILFTDQDELLTQVSFDGEVEWNVEVGEVFNPLLLGDIDSIPGDEIAVYPFATVTNISLGAVRNLDTHYVLDVDVTFSESEILQGEPFNANVTVVNIYGESISDASVYMSTLFMTPEGLAVNTFGFYYNWITNKYHGQTDATWPMGPVNLSIFIDHEFYHPYEDLYIDAVIVRSPLHITIDAPPSVNQGENMSIAVWVFDNLDGIVDDATVSVMFGGSGQVATQSGPLYLVDIPEVQVGVGAHIISAIATHPYAIGPGTHEKPISVQILASSLIVSTDFPVTVQQDEIVSSWFNVTDQYGDPISGAFVTLNSGPVVFELIESSVPGCYNFTSPVKLGIGNQTFELRIQRMNIVGSLIAEVSFDVFGDLEPNVFYIPRVEGGSEFEVTVFVKDKYGPVFAGTSVTIEINGTLYTSIYTTDSPEYTLLVVADFLSGENKFIVSIIATYATPWSGNFSIRSYSDAASSSEVHSSNGWILTQGDQTNVELQFLDWAHRPVSGATVTFFIKALSYSLQETIPGIYSATISTSGWLPGEYEYVISVDHPDVETGEPIVGIITVMGDLEFFVSYSPETPTQGEELIVNINIVDGYGNPVPDLEVTIDLMELPMLVAMTTDQIGEYVVIIPHVPTNMGYGDFTLTVIAVGEFVGETVDSSNTIPVAPATPDFAMSTSSLSIGAGASFVLSLIGMVIYFRIASSMRVEDKTLQGRKKSIRNMDRLYLLIVFVSGAGLVGSYSMYTAGNYAIALVLTVALLGCSVLLYGLWLYRDANAAVLVRGSLSRGRMVLGLWHLVFVPVVIFLILLYGVEIDWFKAYIIDQSFTIGTISVPSIMTTIFAAYMSSILVVVVNLYREVSKGLKKIEKMEEAGTPESIVEDEKTSMVSRFSSSVRIKFLMFLVVVGATTVMSMDFLASWELGVIVLLPIAFLVVIPFISSKIIQVFSKLSRGKIPTAPVDT